jgi:hypothetical protein
MGSAAKFTCDLPVLQPALPERPGGKHYTDLNARTNQTMIYDTTGIIDSKIF